MRLGRPIDLAPEIHAHVRIDLKLVIEQQRSADAHTHLAQVAPDVRKPQFADVFDGDVGTLVPRAAEADGRLQK